MYIWIGCKLPEEFESSIRDRCIPLGKALGLDMSGFSLPQHISLKISFPSDNQTDILDAVEELLCEEKEFYVNPEGVGQNGSILWLTFRENPTLRRLHAELDRELQARFSIPQHSFDKKFEFHSTLFLGDSEILQQAREALADLPLPSLLKIDTLLIGVSETGKSGTYRVVRTIRLSER